MGGAIPLRFHGEGRDDFTFAFKAISLPVSPPPPSSLSIIISCSSMPLLYTYNVSTSVVRGLCLLLLIVLNLFSGTNTCVGKWSCEVRFLFKSHSIRPLILLRFI